MSKRKLHLAHASAVLLAMVMLFSVAGCKKKVPPPPPPPPPKVETPPPPPKPAIGSFTADPRSIERGQASTLRWSVSNATDITIDQSIGAVQSTGSRQVFPANSTTYTLVANGPGGSATSTVTVDVRIPPPPPPPPPPPAPPKRSATDILASDVEDAFFDYDKNDIREDARAALTKNAEVLKQLFADNPGFAVQIEGHCDERGSAEYNLGLGDRRATSAKDFLVSLGVPADRLKTISYGKERPQCTEADEGCYQKNRRAHFSPGQ